MVVNFIYKKLILLYVVVFIYNNNIKMSFRVPSHYVGEQSLNQWKIQKPTVESQTLIDLIDEDKYDEITKALNMYFFNGFEVIDIQNYLYCYSIANKDIALMVKIYDKIEKYTLNIFDLDNLCDCDNDFIDEFFRLNEHNIDVNISNIANSAITKCNYYIIQKIETLDYVYNNINFMFAIKCKNMDMSKYILDKCENMEKAFEEHCIKNIFEPITCEKLKYIMDRGVDVTKYLDNLFKIAGTDGNTEFIIFCHKLGGIITSGMCSSAISHNNCELVIYYLQNGFDINTLLQDDVKYVKLKMFKILFDNNYIFDNETLNYIFTNTLVCNSMDDALVMFDYVNNFDYIFEKEKRYTENYIGVDEYSQLTIGHYIEVDEIPSILEYLIVDNKIDQIQFIIDNAKDNIDISKLFIVATANNNVDIANILLKANENVDYDVALEFACFFGHYDMVLYLLKVGASIHNELFKIAAYGSSYRNRNIGYQILLQKVKILNDSFKYGEKYNEIFKLLVDNNIFIDKDTFDVINPKHLSVDIVIKMLDNYDINDVLKKIVLCDMLSEGDYSRYQYAHTYTLMTKKNDKLVNIEIPDNINQILKYLLNNGANPNVDSVVNNNVIAMLELYK